jgi:hypothetical protein
MQRNVEFGYKLSICSGIEENHGKPGSSWPVAGPSGCKLTSSHQSGIKDANPNISPYLANGLHKPVVPLLMGAEYIENTASCWTVFTERSSNVTIRKKDNAKTISRLNYWARLITCGSWFRYVDVICRLHAVTVQCSAL